jgi:hypothetical protein
MTSISTTLSNIDVNWVQVAHTCNPSYSGGRDKEDHSPKPDQANSSRDLISKKNALPTSKNPCSFLLLLILSLQQN